MPSHKHQTRILGSGAVSLGRSHIDPASLRVGGQPVPEWLVIDADSGFVRRTDGIVGDKTRYAFEYEYDDAPARRRADLQAKAAAARDSAAASDRAGWTAEKALAWHQEHIDDVLDDLKVTGAQATVVDVLRALADESKALLQLVIAQRNERWPDLEDQAED